mgnify:CR=1 FL=1
MIEERIIEWLDLGDSVQKVDIYERPKLLIFFKYHYLLIKHGISSEVVDIIFLFIFFLQIISLAAANVDSEGDLILDILKYFEIIIVPHKIISNSKSYIIVSSINWGINIIHIILSGISFFLLYKKAMVKILFFLISLLNYIIFYYLIGTIAYIALYGTLCKNGEHELLKVECYSNPTHLAFTIINIIFGLYSIFATEAFSLYHNQIGSIFGSDVKTRVNCDYDIYSSNAKLIVYIIVYFYMKYSQDSPIFKYIYQVYIFLSCFFLSVYTMQRVFYYNKRINTIIHYCWYLDTWFALCMLLKVCFNIVDITIFVLFGWILLIIVLTLQNKYSYYKAISQFDLLNEQSLVYIEKFNSVLMDLYNSNKKNDKLMLVGIIKKFEDYIHSNPELNGVFNKLMNDKYMKKKFFALNQLPMLSMIYSLYSLYLEKSEIKNDVTLHMCYFLINKLKNPTYAISLISKLKTTNHAQLYHKYTIMEEIKEYLITKLIKKSFQDTINHVQIGSVILYNQYIDLFKIKIYDGTCNQIDYFDILRNNVTTNKITENFLKIGENILKLKKEILKLWEKIIDLNPFSNESENDYMLYLKTILQDDIMAKNEEKKYNLFKSSKISEKNNVYHSMFKNDINSVLLVDGYTTNGKILYTTPNFPYLYKFNGKEIINTQIEELLPNVIQPFHKDLIENALKYSNITNLYHNRIADNFLKGKNNSLYNVRIYLKPVPNLVYGLVYFILLTKNQEHEFIITLDKDFKIDGFTEMNQGNNFTLSNNLNNNYNLSSSSINHHIGIIIPELLLQLCYKDNCFYVSKNNMDIKGTLYSINNIKEIDPKIYILLEIIKKKGFLNLEDETDEGKRILYEYNEFKRYIMGRQNRTFSIFFKVVTREFLGGKYRYHRVYISNDPLSLNENHYFEQTINVSESDDMNEKKKLHEKQATLGKVNNDADDNNNNNAKGSSKKVNLKYYPKESKKAIKLKIPLNKQIKNTKCINAKYDENNFKNNEENQKEKENMFNNKMTRINTLRSQMNVDSAGFNKLKNGIINKKDSVQITFMKYVSLLFVIITVILVVYDYTSSNKLYSNLVQFLDENLYFTHSKIITSCVYISSVNIKWLKYKYIEEDSCPQNCTTFYIKLLDKCVKILKNGKDTLFTFNYDFQEIILKRRRLEIKIFNTNITDKLDLDLNDHLNFIITKGIKIIGSSEDYFNYYETDKVNMENLIHQSINFFRSEIEGFIGDDKIRKVNSKFKNNYLTIIIGTALCLILLSIFSYFIFDFNQLELFFLDKLINFNSSNFELYLKNLEDLKKKLKNYKNEEEENNIDDLEIELLSNKEADTKAANNSKSKKEQKKMENNKIKEGNEGKGDGEGEVDDEEPKKMNNNNRKKRGNKQNKLQQQRIKKKKIMSFYFFKENLFFAIKTSMILICFVSFFVVSFLIYKEYLKSFLKFDTSTNNVENLYYESIRIFLIFKSELVKFEAYKDINYNMSIPLGKEIQMPNFGNTLNDLSQNAIFSKKNKEVLTQLYNGDLCLLLFQNTSSLDYNHCKEFLSSILLKGMEQAIIQMGVMVNSVIDELTLIKDQKDFYNIIKGNSSNFKKYELFIEYYLLLSYLKNEEIFNNFRINETHYFSNLTMKIIIIYFIVYLVLFIMLCYFIFMYKYIYNSLFNFIAILSIKFISDDEYLNKKIIELEKKLYK